MGSGSEWGDAAISHGMPGAPKAVRGKEESPLKAMEGPMALLMP